MSQPSTIHHSPQEQLDDIACYLLTGSKGKAQMTAAEKRKLITRLSTASGHAFLSRLHTLILDGDITANALLLYKPAYAGEDNADTVTADPVTIINHFICCLNQLSCQDKQDLIASLVMVHQNNQQYNDKNNRFCIQELVLEYYTTLLSAWFPFELDDNIIKLYKLVALHATTQPPETTQSTKDSTDTHHDITKIDELHVSLSSHLPTTNIKTIAQHRVWRAPSPETRCAVAIEEYSHKQPKHGAI